MALLYNVIKSVLFNAKTKSISNYIGRRNYVTYKLKERTMKIRGKKINYLIVGNGEHRILCYPGFLGTIWTHFKKQIDGMDRTQFTLVLWEPPGYGLSRKDDTKVTLDSQEYDIHYAYDLMQELGFSKFSAMGWCIGGISAMFLAANYPDQVTKLVVWNTFCYISQYELDTFGQLKDLQNWDIELRLPLSVVYTKKTLRKAYKIWYDNMLDIYENRDGDVCKHILPHIQCPCMVLACKDNHLVSEEQTSYLVDQIKGSELVFFESGNAIHIKYADDFNKIVSDFLLR